MGQCHIFVLEFCNHKCTVRPIKLSMKACMVKKAIFAFDCRVFSSKKVFLDLHLPECPSLHFYFIRIFQCLLRCFVFENHGNDLNFNLLEGIVTEFTSELHEEVWMVPQIHKA